MSNLIGIRDKTFDSPIEIAKCVKESAPKAANKKMEFVETINRNRLMIKNGRGIL